MFESTQSETDSIPLVTLPLRFQERLIQLACVPDLKNLRKICPEINHLCRFCAKEFDRFYLTDDDNHFQRAKFYCSVFWLFKYLYIWLHLFFDDLYSFQPTWRNMCSLSNVEKNRRKFYVTDTLVLYCASSDSYDKFIPYICGPYTKISIRGKVRWDQVKRLIHQNVKEVQIFAKMELRPDEFDEFAAFIEQHLRGYQYKFAFTYYMEYTLILAKKVEAACRHKRFHDFFHFNFTCGLVDWRKWWFQVMLWPIILGSMVVVPPAVSWILTGEVFSAYCVVLFIFGLLSFYATIIFDNIARDSLRI